MDRRTFTLGLPLLAACATDRPSAQDGPYQSTGIKICEADSNSATVWTRTTAKAERVGPEGGIPVIQYKDGRTGELTSEPSNGRHHEAVGPFPDGEEVHKLEGAAPGAPGETRVRYRKQGDAAWSETAWGQVTPDADFTRHIELTGLEPGSRYELEVEARPAGGDGVSSKIAGGFKTAPTPDDDSPRTFVVTTCTAYPDRDLPDGYKMYAHMLKLDPEFFVHTGDVVYYDKLAKNQSLARWHWHRMYSLPTNVDFHRQVSSYFIKDDHDVWVNDCWPTMETQYMGDFTFEQGQRIFPEQTAQKQPAYRTVRWGKDLQVWFPEGRDYRTPNDMEDGPEKTIWGAEQKEWLKRTMTESDAAFKLVIGATPVVGPDRQNKRDNHSNGVFKHEGEEIRAFLAGLGNAYAICGDRHWQYVSRDSKTGLMEFAVGSASDEHAGGFKMDLRTDEHLYLNIVGGFFSGTVERVDGKPRLTLRHYSVDGQVLNEVVREAV
ncbi:MAG: alkaline phosphatase D family protein [Bryobacterales bacterium]